MFDWSEVISVRFAPLWLVAADRNMHAGIQVSSAQIAVDRSIDIAGPGCYDYGPETVVAAGSSARSPSRVSHEEKSGCRSGSMEQNPGLTEAEL
jgi:hypothetical protein